MTPKLALAICASLAVSESVQLELIKLIALTVTTGASTFAAWLAYKNRSTVKDVQKTVRQKRHATREGEPPVIVEERRRSPRDKEDR